MKLVPRIAEAGVTHVWLPPPSQSVSPEGIEVLNVTVSVPVSVHDLLLPRRFQ